LFLKINYLQVFPMGIINQDFLRQSFGPKSRNCSMTVQRRIQSGIGFDAGIKEADVRLRPSFLEQAWRLQWCA
jgi:hypothetical protein